MLGNGGTTAFWDAATCGLVRERSLHLTYGEFSSKFAACTRQAPFLADPIVVSAEPGDAPEPGRRPGRRRHRLGPQRDLDRRHGAGHPPGRQPSDALVLIDATSGAAGLPVDVGRVRRLLLRPPEGLCLRRRPVAGRGQPGGDRADRADGGRPARPARWIPDFLSLTTALENSRKDQTYNTPALATLLLLADQLDWMLAGGGLEGMVKRTTASSQPSTAGPTAHREATPFVADPAKRSLVVGTIDFDDEIDAAELAAQLRANGIVDVEPYRKLGRNQLRVAMFPATDPADVAGADRVHRLGAGAAVMSGGNGQPRVLVAEKIGDSGINLLREHFDVELGVGLESRRSSTRGSATSRGS